MTKGYINTPSFWDLYPDKVDDLKKMWLSGEPASMIARQLSPQGLVSRNAVIGKAHRLGLRRFQRRLIEKKPEQETAKPERRVRLRILPEMTDVISRSTIMPATFTSENMRDLPFERPATAVSLFDAQPHHCRWPVGEPREFLFCGDIAVPDGRLRFCAGHYRRAITHSMKVVRNAPAYVAFRR